MRAVFLAVLKVFEGGFRVFKRCFSMAFLQRMVNIRLGYFRFGVIFWGVRDGFLEGIFKVFFQGFKGVLGSLKSFL